MYPWTYLNYQGIKNTNTWATMPILVAIYHFVLFGKHQSPTHIIGVKYAVTVIAQFKNLYN